MTHQTPSNIENQASAGDDVGGCQGPAEEAVEEGSRQTNYCGSSIGAPVGEGGRLCLRRLPNRKRRKSIFLPLPTFTNMDTAFSHSGWDFISSGSAQEREERRERDKKERKIVCLADWPWRFPIPFLVNVVF
jgi:hypothetical protein